MIESILLISRTCQDGAPDVPGVINRETLGYGLPDPHPLDWYIHSPLSRTQRACPYRKTRINQFSVGRSQAESKPSAPNLVIFKEFSREFVKASIPTAHAVP